MVLVKILKRKDASSIIVAIIVAMIIGQVLAMVMMEPASKLIGKDSLYGEGGFGGPDWKTIYLQPVVAAGLQLIALELLAWIVIGVEVLVKPKATKHKTKK